MVKTEPTANITEDELNAVEELVDHAIADLQHEEDEVLKRYAGLAFDLVTNLRQSMESAK